MSDIQLETEMDNIIKRSGYNKSEKMISSIVRIISMRYKDVPIEQTLKVAKSIFKHKQFNYKEKNEKK